MKKKVLFSIICLGVILSMVHPVTSNAYLFTNSKIKNPKDGYYWIHDAFNDYSLKAEVKEGVLAWNKSSKIEFTKNSKVIGNSDVKIEYSDRYNGNLYGVHRSYGNITLYKKWRVGLGKTTRIETVVHEVGHALGLDHTQKKNNAISVMRMEDFNYTKTPLKDDWAGINKKYK